MKLAELIAEFKFLEIDPDDQKLVAFVRGNLPDIIGALANMKPYKTALHNMPGKDYKKIQTFEKKIQVGDKVYFLWTCFGNPVKGRATVQKINARSFVVAFDEPIKHNKWEPYPIGFTLNVPRIEHGGWSLKNRIEPIKRSKRRAKP